MKWYFAFSCLVFIKTGLSSQPEVDVVIEEMENTLNFSQDFLLLKRIAYIESMFGDDVAVMTSNPNGGIWQITNRIYEEVLANSSKLIVVEMLEEIEKSFNINCLLCTYNFSDHMHSVLAARIFIELTSETDNRILLEDQAKWWATLYHVGGNGTEFLDKSLELHKKIRKENEPKLDLWILLDASEDVMDEDFQVSLNFTCSLAEEFNISRSATQVGFSVCSNQHDEIFYFENSTSFPLFQESVLSTSKPDYTLRNTGHALQDTVIRGFNASNSSLSDGVDKVILIITSGKSSDNISEPLKSVMDAGITLHAVTICEYNETESNLMVPGLNENRITVLEKFSDLLNVSYQNIIYEKATTKSQVNNFSVEYHTKLKNLSFTWTCMMACISETKIFVTKDYTVRSFQPGNLLVCRDYTDFSSLFAWMLREFNVDCNTCSDENMRIAQMNFDSFDEELQLEVEEGRGDEMLAEQFRWIRDTNLNNDACDHIANVINLGKTRFKMNVWFLLDGSRAITEENFQIILNFTSDMAELFNISSSVDLGYSVFHETNNIGVNFDEAKNTSFFQSYTLSTERLFGKPIGGALQEVHKNGFSLLTGARPVAEDIHRVIFVITVGGVTDDVAGPSSMIHGNSTTIFAIGVGANVDDKKLNIIASTPTYNYKYHLPDFGKLHFSMVMVALNNIARLFRSELYVSTQTTSESFSTTSLETTTLSETTASVIAFLQPTQPDPQTTLAPRETVTGLKTDTTTDYTKHISESSTFFPTALPTHTLLSSASSPALSSSDTESSVVILVPEDIPGSKDFQTDEDSSLQTGLIVGFFVFCVLIAVLLLIKRKHSKIQDDEEARVDLTIKKVLRELKTLSERAKNPNATVTCLQKLFKKLSEAERLGVSEETLEGYYDAMFDLKNRHFQIIEEIKGLTEDAKQTEPDQSCVHNLKRLLYTAEKALISPNQLIKAYAALDVLKKCFNPEPVSPEHERVMRDLFNVSDASKEEYATNESLNLLEQKLEAAEALYIPPRELSEHYKILDSLRHRLYEILDELNETAIEGDDPSADAACMLKLQKQLDLAEGLLIPEKHLKVPYEVLERLKQRLHILKQLQELTERALKPTATTYCLHNLEKQVDAARRLDVPEELLKDSDDALILLGMRLQSRVDLKKIEEEACNPAAGRLTLTKLQKQIETMEGFGISGDELQEAKLTLESLTKRVKALEDLKLITNEANQPTVSRKCFEKLKNCLEIAVDLGIPETHLKHGYRAFVALEERLQKLEELKNIASEAREPCIDHHVLEKLERQYELCANTYFIPQKQTQESDNALDLLRKRIKVNDALNELMEQASDPVSETAFLKKLQEMIKAARSLNVPQENLEKADRLAENFKHRIFVLEELYEATNEANIPTLSQETFKKIQHLINTAEELKISDKKLKGTKEALELLRKRLDVLEDLSVVTEEVKEPTATNVLVVQLEKKLDAAVTLKIPVEYLNESYKVLDILKLRLKAEDHLRTIMNKARDPRAGKPVLEKLQKQLKLAESLNVFPDRLIEPYAVSETLRVRIAALEDLQSIAQEAKNSRATQVNQVKLQEQLNLLINLNVEKDQLQFANGALKLVRKRLRAKEELSHATSRALHLTATQDCLKLLQNKVLEIEELGIPQDCILESYEAMELLKKRLLIVEELVTVTEEAKQPQANYTAMKKLVDQIALVESYGIPPDSVKDSYHTLKMLSARINKVKGDVGLLVAEANEKTANVFTLRKMEAQLNVARTLDIPSSDITEGYEALKYLVTRDREVESIKNDLRNALLGTQAELKKVLITTKTMKYLQNWNPDDTEWNDLFKQAKKREESITLQNSSRGSLLQAMDDDDIDPDEFEHKLERFQMYLDIEIGLGDQNLLTEARQRLIDITRYRVLLRLQRGIGMRIKDMLVSALHYKDLAFEKKLKDYNLNKDIELSTHIHKAEELVNLFSQLERMKSVVMSLKQPTISEIRSYSHPPILIRNVMEATLILLGEDKKKVEDWMDIQVMVGKIGKDALKKRIWERDLEAIRVQDAELAAELLVELKLEAVEEISKAASVFFSWSLCVIQEVRERLPTCSLIERP